MQMLVWQVCWHVGTQQSSQAAMTGTLLSPQDVAVSHFAEPPIHCTDAVDCGLTLVHSQGERQLDGCPSDSKNNLPKSHDTQSGVYLHHPRRSTRQSQTSRRMSIPCVGQVPIGILLPSIGEGVSLQDIYFLFYCWYGLQMGQQDLVWDMDG